ncbi:MAG: Holliday junction resolvase RuvX [candidate division Zixibacteria bacterium]|nr:Holliday junction resolvase RuvX [candidate division Zixibacteria bacterium]
MATGDEISAGGRVLAVDYGRRRIGLAISDPTGTIATGLGTLVVKNDNEAVSAIAAGRPEWEYRRIVVGLPLRTTGEHGDMAEAVLGFVDKLKAACPVPVETLDERFTSAEAHRIFGMSGKKLKGRKEQIDRIAAEILLRQYLDSLPSNLDNRDE